MCDSNYCIYIIIICLLMSDRSAGPDGQGASIRGARGHLLQWGAAQESALVRGRARALLSHAQNNFSLIISVFSFDLIIACVSFSNRNFTLSISVNCVRDDVYFVFIDMTNSCTSWHFSRKRRCDFNERDWKLFDSDFMVFVLKMHLTNRPFKRKKRFISVHYFNYEKTLDFLFIDPIFRMSRIPRLIHETSNQ